MKEGWMWVKFGEVVRLNTERCADPLAEGIERYVGLEHLTPGDLRVREWGLVAEGTTFTNLFRPGQVLFGKRRAYQRKVAVADFSGVCSGDIYVFESRDPERLLPELLPFICQTERFFEYAVGTSAGSLSPRTNWTQLAEYEFALPPLDEQHRLTTLLEAIISCSNSLHDLLYSCSGVEASFLKSSLGNYTDQQHAWPKVELQQVAFVQTGVAKGGKEKQGVIVELPYLAVSNVQDGYLDLSEIKTISVENDKIDRYRLQNGDVLLTEGGDPDKLGRGTVWQGEIANCLHQNHIFAVRPNYSYLNSWYLAAVARSTYGKQYFLGASKRTSNLATINKQQVSAFLVPLPNLDIQGNFVAEWMSIKHSAGQIVNRLQTLLSLKATIMRNMTRETE